MDSSGLSYSELLRDLLEPEATRGLMKRFEALRAAIVERLQNAGCPAELVRETNEAWLAHQRTLNVMLAGHAERLEAWAENRPEFFERLREQLAG